MFPKTFWGWAVISVAHVAASPVTLPVAVVAGTMEAANGGSFGEGAYKVLDVHENFIEKAGDWGDRHNEAITDHVVGAVVSNVIGRAFKPPTALFRLSRVVKYPRDAEHSSRHTEHGYKNHVTLIGRAYFCRGCNPARPATSCSG